MSPVGTWDGLPAGLTHVVEAHTEVDLLRGMFRLRVEHYLTLELLDEAQAYDEDSAISLPRSHPKVKNEQGELKSPALLAKTMRYPYRDILGTTHNSHRLHYYLTGIGRGVLKNHQRLH